MWIFTSETATYKNTGGIRGRPQIDHSGWVEFSDLRDTLDQGQVKKVFSGGTVLKTGAHL